MYINGEYTEAKEFFYDGCHKIYLIEDESDKTEMFENGYEASDIYPISKLSEIWDKCCSLRFISNVKLTKRYIKQFEDADFEYVN